MCTLSGYWKAKFAEHGTITASNPIDTSAAGYQSLSSVNAVYSLAAPGFSTLGRSGFYNDLGTTSLINPIGASGLSYCQCVAIMVNGCESSQSQLATNPTGPGSAAGNVYATAGTTGLTATTLATILTATAPILNDLSEEYNSLATYIQEAIGNDRSANTAAAPFNDATAFTFSKQGDIDAVNAILGSLGKLDKCASMAFDVIA